MSEPLSDFDPAVSLTSRDPIAVFLSDAFETGDARHVALALDVAVRAGKERRIVESAGLPPGDLDDLPLATVFSVTKALGLNLSVVPTGALDGPPVGRELE